MYFYFLLVSSEILSLGDKKRRGRPHNVAGALSGPKPFSLSNNPISVIWKNVVVDNDVGIIVGYSKSSWIVRFPTVTDEEEEVLTNNYTEKQVLEGIDKYKKMYGG